MAARQLPNQGGLFDRHCAENHPVEPEAQQGLGPLQTAHAAAKLHRNRQGGHDRPHHGIVQRQSAAGAIEVHQVEPLSALLLPGQGLGHRIVAETGHLVVIPLMQPHALAVEQVDGGNDLHGAPQGLPARLPELAVTQALQRHHQTEGALQHRCQFHRPFAPFAPFADQGEMAEATGARQHGRLGGPGGSDRHRGSPDLSHHSESDAQPAALNDPARSRRQGV
jgi:hypothetical protein